MNDPPRLLFVGYLRPEKGIETLIEAFFQLRRQRPLRLTLVGGADRAGGAGQRVQEAIARSPFRDDVAQLGMMEFGPQLFDLYRTHDVFVLPSLSEGTPRTLVEARAFGCPVVASRVGGVPSSVEHERDGLLVEPRNAGALATEIARLLDDKVLRQRLIEHGLQRARETTLERFADQLVEELRACRLKDECRRMKDE